MKIGACTSVNQAKAAAEAGFDYIEENVQNFLVPEAPDDLFAPFHLAAQNASLPVIAANCFLPASIKCTGPEVDLDRIVRYAGTAFRRAREVGMRFIVFGSGGARQIPEGFDSSEARKQFVDELRRIAPLAEKHDITLVIEPLGRKECNFITTLVEGASIIQESNHPHVRLLADFYHMAQNEEDPNEIAIYGQWIHHVHVAEKNGRLAPGSGGEDFGPQLRALKKADYRGSISYECSWKQFPDQAASGMKDFREQVRQAGLS